MRNKIIIMILLLTITLCGCSETKDNVVESYSEDMDIYLYIIDSELYGTAIEDLIYYSGWDTNTVEDIIDKHSDILTDGMKLKLLYTAQDIDIPDWSDEQEDLTMAGDESFVNEEYDYTKSDADQIMDEPKGEINTTDQNNSDDLYDGLDTNPDAYDPELEDTSGLESTEPDYNLDLGILGGIVAFGLENELDDDSDEEYAINESWMDEELAQQQDEETKVYEVIAIDAYKDRLVCSVIYKYGSPMKVVVDLVDGKIDGYTIYR